MAKRTTKLLPVRLEDSLHARLKKSAEKNKRSLSAEIALRLENSYGIEERFEQRFRYLQQALIEKTFTDALEKRVDAAMNRAADYMLTPEFEKDLDEAIEAQKKEKP